jgi:putative tryptophan/tyrosine transport system substrate-binding protein
VSSDPVFFISRDKLAALAARYSLPAVYADREIAEAGGLISYGANRTDAYRQAGKYAGRILHREKVSELPVVLPTKFDLVVNIKTAKALGRHSNNLCYFSCCAHSRHFDAPRRSGLRCRPRYSFALMR